jgi:primosomal protein N' (replication factor Y)
MASVSSESSPQIVRVALPVPLRRLFDYTLPEGTTPRPGCRIKVPFGRRTMTGLVISLENRSDITPDKLKTAIECLDTEPLIETGLMKFLSWIADYYLHPPGEVLFAALPVKLRQGHPAILPVETAWRITDAGREKLLLGPGRAKVQHAVLSTIAEADVPVTPAVLKAQFPGWRAAANALLRDAMIIEQELQPAKAVTIANGPDPTRDQQNAIDSINASKGRYCCFLLHGITGSGKTEVYLRSIETVLLDDRQALVLVPEISLTPQLVDRFRTRFSCPIEVMHSAMTDTQRMHAWERSRRGMASIIIGTRSAVFTPMQKPGIIIVDEEHDTSFKQQDGLRYHARDLAIKRASDAGIPVVLGSATPSLESYANAASGRYKLLSLTERATRASMPAVHILDMHKLPVDNGISMPLRDALRENFQRGNQSLLFLNRRGFAPAVCCTECNWLAHCIRCDAKLTWHRNQARLRCHHCGHEARWPEQCPDCGAMSLVTVGQGTEHIEEAIRKLVPDARIERIDRDTTRRKGELEDRLDRIHCGEADILVGTQMLSKGHDFPNVTLVGVIDTDQLLFSSDFRASERLFQLVTQVAGRAGRAEKPGTVLIQSRYPDSPWLRPCIDHDFEAFARMALDERMATDYPPYQHLALLRAEAPHQNAALEFLNTMHRAAMHVLDTHDTISDVAIMDPLPSVMEKRAGRYRAQLLTQSPSRSKLHMFLHYWVEAIETSRLSRNVRWSLDVDPVDLF